MRNHKNRESVMKIKTKNITKIVLTTILAFTAIIFVQANTNTNTQEIKKADFVIFSFNRPIQLYALLESTEKYITGIEETHIIYRSSDNNYETGYQEVMRRFPTAIFHKQGENPNKDFKPLTLTAIFGSPSKYVIFAVDDIIVKDSFDITGDIELMEQTNAYGFYYRLGQNIDWCYMLNRTDPLPKLTLVNSDVYSWRIGDGQCDWGYPNTVDMTLYKKVEIASALTAMHYTAPNPLEGYWACSVSASTSKNRLALCHQQSKIVNLPLNIVQSIYNGNRNSNSITPKQLLDKFNSGLKIDIAQLHKINNRSAHIDFIPSFITR